MVGGNWWPITLSPSFPIYLHWATNLRPKMVSSAPPIWSSRLHYVQPFRSQGRVRALQARGTGIETLMLQAFLVHVRTAQTEPMAVTHRFYTVCSCLDGRAVQGAWLKFKYLRMRGFESHSKHFCICEKHPTAKTGGASAAEVASLCGPLV